MTLDSHIYDAVAPSGKYNPHPFTDQITSCIQRRVLAVQRGNITREESQRQRTLMYQELVVFWLNQAEEASGKFEYRFCKGHGNLI